LLVLEELSIVTGIVIAFWTTYGAMTIPSEWSWRLPFILQILPGLVLGVGIIFLPFSPRWLCSKDRDDEALVALSNYVNSHLRTTGSNASGLTSALRLLCMLRSALRGTRTCKSVQLATGLSLSLLAGSICSRVVVGGVHSSVRA
jgi:MFS family permease